MNRPMFHVSRFITSGRLIIQGGAAVLAVFAVVTAAIASDWPQFRGPDRDGLSKETGLLKSWPAGGPKLAWKASNLGEGHAAPSVANGRVYGMGRRGNDEVVWALDEKKGTELWCVKIADGISLQGGQGGYGPRSTPTIDGDRLYTIGVGGELVCLSTANGKSHWHKSLVSDFGGRVPTWGYSESPLIDGEKVIATPGGSNTIVALNKLTGEVIWKAQVPSGNRVAYSSCIAADVDGQREYIQFLGGCVAGVSAKDGKFLWEYDKPACRNQINCASPIYHDHMVFAASAYQNGGGLCKLETKNGEVTATEVYFTLDMQNHHGGVLLIGDYLYGFDDHNRGLTCLELKTGKVMWTNPSVGKGSVTYADGMLITRSEHGPVGLVEASPKEYVEKSRFDQPDRSSAPSWPYPVVANGHLYLRDQDIMLCYDIRESSASK
jgi:outer membrane protein assembly factor BamB